MADPLLHLQPGDEHFWVHHLSPFALVLWHGGHGEPIGIRWYGLAYLAGLLGGYLLLKRWVRIGRAPLQPEQMQDFVLWPGLGMIIGGRLGYCLFYAWPEVARDPLEIFKVWHGGMASHGGGIGLAVGCWLFARRQRVSFMVLADIIAAVATLGIAFGRLANFINGELWGRPSRAPWAVIFPDAPRIGGFDLPRHPSQLYAMVLEGVIPFIITIIVHARHRRPGLTSGVFLCCYAFGRFVDEFFREPDAGQPGSPGVPAILGFMSKGQAFTAPILVLGIALIIWSLRRPARPELYLSSDSSKPAASSQQPAAS